jgi:DNA-binding CsgD family transcriptional regulator
MSGEAPISEREREILRLVAEGATNQQIAQQLDISINTVKVHLRNIFGKIGVASRTEATVYAIRQGLVVVDERQPAALADAPVAVAELAHPAEDGATPTLAATEPSPVEQPGPEIAVQAPAGGVRRWAMPAALLAVALALVAGGVAYLARQQVPPASAEPTPAPLAGQPSRWQERAALPRRQEAFALAALDGRLYVIGGSGPGGASAAVDRYDSANDVWVALTEKPTPAGHIQAAAIGGHIYVPGGEGGDGRPLDVLEAYDPRSQVWETLPPLPAPRSRYALASVEGRLYLFGGWDGGRYCDEVFVYDPQARAWSVDEQRLPTPRRAASAGVVEGRIYVIGGEDERGALRVNERYDPTGDSGRRWESAAPLSVAVAAPAVVGILDVAYVFDPAQRLMLQYTPKTDSWAGVDIPAGIGVTSRATFLGTSVFVFGPPEGGEAGMLSEYKAIFNTFLPGTTGNQ